MESKPKLRFEFVEMLFALAIGQVGVEIGDLVIKENFADAFFFYPSAYMHLILSTTIIVLSWVGWQQSKSSGNTQIIISTFNLQFLILLVDIFLVFCYFIIVRGAEIPNQIDGKLIATKPSTYNETLWSFIIFCTYFVWDIFTKLIVTKIEKKGSAHKVFIRVDIKSFLKRSWQTVICAIISFLFYKFLNGKNDNSHTIITDLCLISLFFYFRGLKQKVKRKYKLDKNEISSHNLAELSCTYPITITENIYGIKLFYIKWIPLILIVILFFSYHKI